MKPKVPRSLKVFVPHPKAQRLRDSALELVRAIVNLDIDLSIKRRMLSHSLWFVTETEGESKYRTRYMSKAAIGRPTSELHHEHVIPRKALVDAMLRDPAGAVEIAATAVGCTVTRKEHHLLTAQDRAQPELNEWERYRAAGIVVINTETGEPI